MPRYPQLEQCRDLLFEQEAVVNDTSYDMTQFNNAEEFAAAVWYESFRTHAGLTEDASQIADADAAKALKQWKERS